MTPMDSTWFVNHFQYLTVGACVVSYLATGYVRDFYIRLAAKREKERHEKRIAEEKAAQKEYVAAWNAMWGTNHSLEPPPTKAEREAAKARRKAERELDDFLGRRTGAARTRGRSKP